MNIQEARELVVLAGKRLVESGLIARTWGNVSCRINDSHFVITPSGRDYLSLTPEEIVEVAIKDCSYQGEIKPSSEKGIHAEVYKLYPEINFVIHTHQEHASLISALDLEAIQVPDTYALLNTEVRCAAYGLPGTKKLKKGVTAALVKSKGKAVIMKHHGALCFGTGYEEAFQAARELEDACKQYILDRYHMVSGNFDDDPVRIGCYALGRLTERTVSPERITPFSPCESERTSYGFIIKSSETAYECSFADLNEVSSDNTALHDEIALHNRIYQDYPNINAICHADTPGIRAVSNADIQLLPLLDDFAQLAGVSVKTVSMDEKAVSAGLKSTNAVFLKNNGALCCGSLSGDAHAATLVVEKNSNALISAALFGKVKYINHLECILMRFVYLNKYSKQVNKK